MKLNENFGFSMISILIGVVIVASLAAFALTQYTQTNPETGESFISESTSAIDSAKDLTESLNAQTEEKNLLINENEQMENKEKDLSGITKATLKTSKGDIVLQLFTKESPITAGNFIKLANEDFYDGTRFHRLIPNFMIQGGDPQSKDESLQARWGTGGPGYAIEDEFIQGLSNERGSISMANSGPNSGGSQFFINVVDNTFLDWDKEPSSSKHPVFGKVIEGLEIADAIVALGSQNGTPSEFITIDDIVLE